MCRNPIGPKAIIARGAQPVPNFIIIRTQQWSTIHRLPADVRTETMRCSVSDNHTIFYGHVDHKCYYGVKTNQ